MNKFMIYVFLSCVLFIIHACNTNKPEPITLNVDNCAFCKMTVADLRFGVELITDKGRVYKFDDFKCMMAYKKENAIERATYYVTDYSTPENMVKAEEAIYVTGAMVQSPMNGNVAAFSKQQEAAEFATTKEAVITNWDELSSKE